MFYVSITSMCNKLKDYEIFTLLDNEENYLFIHCIKTDRIKIFMYRIKRSADGKKTNKK